MNKLNALGLVGLAVGIGTGVVEVLDYALALPELEAGLAAAGFESRDRIAEIDARLSEVESRFGRVTGTRIRSLRDDLVHVDWRSPAGIEAFGHDLQRTINDYDVHMAELLGWDDSDDGELGDVWRERIRYEDGRVIWPDGSEFDIVGDDSAAIYFGGLARDVRDDPRGLPADKVEKIVATADRLFRPLEPDDDRTRHRVAESLRRIREVVERMLTGRHDRLVVRLLVRNKSGLPNAVIGPAVLRLSRNRYEYLDLELGLAGDGQVPPSGAKAVTFVSGGLRERDRNFVAAAIVRGYEYAIAFGDVHGESWTVRGDALAETAAQVEELVAAVRGR